MDKPTPIGYTTQEMRYLIAPLFNLDPDDMGHFVILIDDIKNMKYRVVGCKHVPEFLERMNLETQGLATDSGHNTGTYNVGNKRKGRAKEHHRMARTMLFLRFWRNHTS